MAFAPGMGGPSRLRSPPSLHQTTDPTTDARAHLHRRFTTNNIPTLSTPLSPIGQQRRQAAEPAEFTTAVGQTSSFGTFGRAGAAHGRGREAHGKEARLGWAGGHGIGALVVFLHGPFQLPFTGIVCLRNWGTD